jgi:hypothetical protein
MNIVNLKNKKILYLGPINFYYDQRLINKLKQLGSEVETFELNINESTWKFKIIRKFKPAELQIYKEKFYERVFLKNGIYDYIIVRQGNQVSESFFEKLRNLNPQAKFINFHWDSIRKQYDYRHIIKYFDKVYSFDYKDCEENQQLTYLPLFYIEEYFDLENDKKERKFDLLFIGSWRNKERFNLIRKTNSYCKKEGLRFYYYLYFPYRQQYLLLKSGKIAREAKGKRLSHNQILKLFSYADTVIDFPSSFQTGLTIRTFEALGAGKKLITTNKNIIKEPFYDSNFIDIVDPNNFYLDTNFIKHEPKVSLKMKMQDYSLEAYVNKLFQ